VVPMFHINGWGMAFTSVFAGAKLVLPGAQLDAQSLLRLIDTERVTISGGVPTVWLSVLEALDTNPSRWDVSSVRTLVIGGSAAPETLLRGYEERFGIPVTQAWGMTETTSVATVCTLPHDIRLAPKDVQYAWRVRQGTPMPFVEVRARNEAGLVPWDGRTFGELEDRPLRVRTTGRPTRTVGSPQMAGSGPEILSRSTNADAFRCTIDPRTLCDRAASGSVPSLSRTR
jgi:fatty-acyl-CoA synthase